MLGWMKRLFGNSIPNPRPVLHTGVEVPTWHKGKSPKADKIAEAITACGAEPGDVVEIDEHGAARVVGRRPRVVGQESDQSGGAIRARLREIYGADAPNLIDDVQDGSNVIVYRNTKTV
jgi:hypothetical protein